MAAYPYGDPAILRQAAVRILDQSSASTGPVTVETFNHREVAKRLGDALVYVLLSGGHGRARILAANSQAGIVPRILRRTEAPANE